MTTLNPIKEVKAIRHRLGAEAGYDIHRVFAELRNAGDSSDHSYVDLSFRIAANDPMQRSGEAVFIDVENRSSPPVVWQRSTTAMMMSWLITGLIDSGNAVAGSGSTTASVLATRDADHQ